MNAERKRQLAKAALAFVGAGIACYAAVVSGPTQLGSVYAGACGMLLALGLLSLVVAAISGEET